jgi:transcriptional regulator NrdR family protein
MKKYIVIKRDGTKEDFQPEKIARVAKATGLSEEEANVLAQNVANWIPTQQVPITTLQIRDKVLEELKGGHSYAAGLYEWYEKTKNK